MERNLDNWCILAEMNADQSSSKSGLDKVLTVQVHHQNLDPRTFQVPVKWIYRTSILAWFLILITVVSTVFAVKTYTMKTRGSVVTLQPDSDAVSSDKPMTQTEGAGPDKNASDERPESQPGQPITGTDAIWSGLAPNIALPQKGFVPTIDLSDVKINWQGKFANVTGVVAYREQGKGSQQGHIVVLARGKDRIFAHPETVLNTANTNHLFNAENGEYFSVARFRMLKTKLGPFESPSQLDQIQIYLFDSDNKLLISQSFQYGKK
jgi:hypothetical protein